ncbi:hypothetical protein MTsN3n11_14060 [Qipengyuania sp. MTN3-11]
MRNEDRKYGCGSRFIQLAHNWRNWRARMLRQWLYPKGYITNWRTAAFRFELAQRSSQWEG